MKILRSLVSAQPCLGTTGDRLVLGSMGSSGSDGHAQSEVKVTQAKLLLSPALWTPHLTAALPSGKGAASICNQPQVTRSSAKLLNVLGWKAVVVQRLIHEQICPASLGKAALGRPNCHRLQLSDFMPPAPPSFIFPVVLSYDCTVLKSYNSPYRIAPAASKLTIQHSILINFLGHVLWPAMGGIFQILTWINK